jgi:hypothetical protein
VIDVGKRIGIITGSITMTEQGRYQITVRGWIGQRWANWFDGMAIVYESTESDLPVTVLCGPVADQAALRGILSRIWDLNLCLLSVIRVETGSE